MPERMLLRSGTDWHLDADGIDTFEAFLAERGVDPAGCRRCRSHLPRLRRLVLHADGHRTGPGARLRGREGDGQFAVGFENGRRLTADAVVAAPGIAHFPVIPDWVPGALPDTAGPTPAPSSSSSSSTRLAC